MSLFNRIRTLAQATAKQKLKEFGEQTLKDTCLGQVDGISICNLNLSQKMPKEFLKLTEEALALIKSLDQRRYRRVVRHLDYIVNTELISAGTFIEKFKMCQVDFEKMFANSDHEWSVRWYACLLIHEATHGVLEEKLILYLKDKRERIEGLCHKEEYRFAQRLEPGWADTYVGPFRPELWKLHWDGTQQERLTAWWKRFTDKRSPG